MMSISDQQLAEAIRRGDTAALEEVMAAYSRLVWTVIAGILSPALPREDLEECVADVFISFWQHSDRFDAARGSLKSYLCLLAKSRAIDRLRASAHHQAEPMDSELSDEQSDPSDLFVTKETFEQACCLIQSFPPELRAVAQLRFLFEMPPSAIALRLQMPVESVYLAVRRGKKLLRDGLNADN